MHGFVARLKNEHHSIAYHLTIPLSEVRFEVLLRKSEVFKLTSSPTAQKVAWDNNMMLWLSRYIYVLCRMLLLRWSSTDHLEELMKPFTLLQERLQFWQFSDHIGSFVNQLIKLSPVNLIDECHTAMRLFFETPEKALLTRWQFFSFLPWRFEALVVIGLLESIMRI